MSQIAVQAQAKPTAAEPPSELDLERARNDRRPPMPPRWSIWNDRHKGEDVYILGASPQLASLTKRQLKALSGKVVLGGNNTFYKAPLTYFLSAYPFEIFKAGLHMPEDRLLHIKRLKDEPLNDRISSINRHLYCEDIGLSRYLTHPTPVVYTARNQALAMLHLAIIMGARRAIYIGVDQTNHAYFWQYDDELRAALRHDLHKLQARRNEVPDADYYFEAVYDVLKDPVEAREKMEFYEDFTPKFADYIAQARAFGAEVVATLEGSVVHKAGGTFLPLDNCLVARQRRRALPEPSEPAPVSATSAAPTGLAASAVAGARTFPPVLVTGLSPLRPELALRLKEAGVLMGRQELWSDRGAQAMTDSIRTAVKAAPHALETLWDFPEPLVEDLCRRNKRLRDAVQQLAAVFGRAELIVDLLDPADLESEAQSLWTMRSPWGWESAFDIALLRVFEHMFPGTRFVQITPADPMAAAQRLTEDFAAKVSKLKSVTFDGDPETLRIDGAPPRQMHVLTSAPDEKGPRARFCLRCASLEGALGLVQTHARLGATAAARLGPQRAMIVTDEEFVLRPDETIRKIMDMVGD